MYQFELTKDIFVRNVAPMLVIFGDPEILEGREYVLDVTVYFCYCSMNQYEKFPNRLKNKTL
jgi:hypothetical protein